MTSVKVENNSAGVVSSHNGKVNIMPVGMPEVNISDYSDLFNRVINGHFMPFEEIISITLDERQMPVGVSSPLHRAHQQRLEAFTTEKQIPLHVIPRLPSTVVVKGPVADTEKPPNQRSAS